jgi:hypothetical protein
LVIRIMGMTVVAKRKFITVAHNDFKRFSTVWIGKYNATFYMSLFLIISFFPHI